jgi:hypothetical protein
MFEDGYSGASARGLGAMMAGGAKTKRTRRENDLYPTAWEATAALALHQKAALVAHVVWDRATTKVDVDLLLKPKRVEAAMSDLMERVTL